MFSKDSLLLATVIIIFIGAQINVASAGSLTVYTDKTKYEYGDHLTIIFEVSEIKDKLLTFQIRDSQGKTSPAPPVEISKLKTEMTAPFPFYSNVWRPGTYYIDARYGGNNSTTSFLIIGSEKIVIPYWVKEIIGSWSQGKYSDNDFARQIKYLIDEDIISVPQLKNQKESSVVKIPSWVKNNAKWWTEDLISDSDFAFGMQYLLKVGIMKV